jgi:hypothetical protein
VYLCGLCGSQNKQRLFPYTALTGWFYNRDSVFTARYEQTVEMICMLTTVLIFNLYVTLPSICSQSVTQILLLTCAAYSYSLPGPDRTGPPTPAQSPSRTVLRAVPVILPERDFFVSRVAFSSGGRLPFLTYCPLYHRDCLHFLYTLLSIQRVAVGFPFQVSVLF